MGNIQGFAFKIVVFIIVVNLAIGLSHLLHPEAYASVETGLIINNTTYNEFIAVGGEIEIPQSNIGSFFSSIWDFFLLSIFQPLFSLLKILSGYSIIKTLEQFGFDTLLGGFWGFMKYAVVSIVSSATMIAMWSMISQGLNLGDDF